VKDEGPSPAAYSGRPWCRCGGQAPRDPGALLPAREILADLLLENGAAPEAPEAYQAVLKVSPRRFNATASAARAADKAETAQARAYALQLLEIARDADTARPELDSARSYLASVAKLSCGREMTPPSRSGL
jgi:hypothetical protein